MACARNGGWEDCLACCVYVNLCPVECILYLGTGSWHAFAKKGAYILLMAMTGDEFWEHQRIWSTLGLLSPMPSFRLERGAKIDVEGTRASC